MKIYNTLTRQKEEFVPLKKNEVKIYACGPTVYNFIHIGNARPACIFDTLHRYFKYKGYNVNYVQNYTDVDDKIINRANEENVSSSQISEKYIAQYEKDAKGLNLLKSTNNPKVTENMDVIIEIIEKLQDNGYAYESSGDVYFSTAKFDGYGKLSHMPLEELEAGARIAPGEHKNNPMDFALWKASKPNEPSWDSRWGKGRPGWHIECSAMVYKYLGETIDIHCGGVDLIFPHHENEIAQSEAALGVKFSNYWMHNGYINIDNKKMSKSDGNFFTVREVADKFGYEPIRYMMLSAHYRSPINYSIEVINQSKAALERLYNFKRSIEFAKQTATNGEIDAKIKEMLDLQKDKFDTALEDDFNTAEAIAAIFDIVKNINQYISSSDNKLITTQTLDYTMQIFGKLIEVLGLLEDEKDEKDEIPEEIKILVEQRKTARENKNYAAADELRNQINDAGFIIEETKQGTRIYRK